MAIRRFAPNASFWTPPRDFPPKAADIFDPQIRGCRDSALRPRQKVDARSGTHGMQRLHRRNEKSMSFAI
jgi:hypothetical protein